MMNIIKHILNYESREIMLVLSIVSKHLHLEFIPYNPLMKFFIDLSILFNILRNYIEC